MRRGALLFLAANALACSMILSLPDDLKSAPVALVEAGAGPVEAGGDVCPIAARPPGPPDVPDDGPSNRYVFMIHHLDLTANNGTAGYDLDGVCSCDSRDTSIHAGGFSCKLPADHPADAGCDLDGGIDSIESSLIGGFSIFAGTTDLESGTNCGRVGIFVVVDNYNGTANDPDVRVSYMASYGIFDGTNHPATSPDCEGGGHLKDGDPYPPLWNGTDRWSFREKDVATSNPPVPNKSYSGWVRDGQLIVDTIRTHEQRASASIVYAGSLLQIATPVVTARIRSDESGALHLEDGILAARATANDVLDAIGAVQFQQKPICDNDAGLFQLVKQSVCQNRESVLPAEQDFKDQNCNALSISLGFTADPVNFGEAYEPPDDIALRCTAKYGGCDP